MKASDIFKNLEIYNEISEFCNEFPKRVRFIDCTDDGIELVEYFATYKQFVDYVVTAYKPDIANNIFICKDFEYGCVIAVEYFDLIVNDFRDAYFEIDIIA